MLLESTKLVNIVGAHLYRVNLSMAHLIFKYSFLRNIYFYATK